MHNAFHFKPVLACVCLSSGIEVKMDGNKVYVSENGELNSSNRKMENEKTTLTDAYGALLDTVSLQN